MKLDFRIKNHVMLFLVFLGGVFFFVLLWAEYQKNIDLIDRNESLLVVSAEKTLRLYVEQDFSALPKDLNVLKEGWQGSVRDVYWFNGGRQEFPFVYRNVGGVDRFSSMRTLYSLKGLKNLPPPIASDSEGSDQRRSIVAAIIDALESENESALRSTTAEFLQHKRNYRLLPQEEIVSWLALLEHSQWSRAFAQSALLDGWPDGDNIIASVADIYLRQNATISPLDMSLIYHAIVDAARRYELSMDRLAQLHEKLTQPFEMNNNLAEGIWLKDTKWLIEKTELGAVAILANIEARIVKTQSLLQSQGLLEPSDYLTLENEIEFLALDSVRIGIHKSSLLEARSQQLFSLAVKGVFLSAFMLLVMFFIVTVQKTARRKQALVDLQDDFINLISHELKTPLASIRIMTETLEKRINNGLDPRDYTKRILSESDKLQIMLENILSLRHLNEGAELSTDILNVKMLIGHVLADVDESSQGEINIRCELPDELKFKANSILFSLVIRNLISNAKKYCLHGTCEIRISYLPETQVITFSDNGVGIDEENWQCIFDKFYRVDCEIAQTGMGLGLPLSRAIMRSFGGDLKVANSNKRGTDWHLCLVKSQNV